MKRLFILLGVVVTVLALAVPVSAITRGGAPDDGEHPYVGLMVAKDVDGNPLWRCSGTLIAEDVYLTAGHCTESPAVSATIWFEEDVESGIPDNGYPIGGPTSVDGIAFTHPLYDPGAFFLYDLGIVQLDEPVMMPEYGALPEEDAIDALGKGRKKAVVEAVGYGLQKINPVTVQADRIRLKADLMVVSTNGAGINSYPDSNSMLVSGDVKHGGTCFGDSGGPMFIGTDSNVIGAVTSYGFNGNCAGVGGAFRIDRALELGWINSFLD